MGEIPGIVTAVSDIVTADSEKTLGIGHVRLESAVTLARNTQVRPVITYAFFLLFTTVKTAALYVLVSEKGLSVIQALPQIWDPETQALFAAVMSFWFGQRALAKARGK